MARKVTVQRTNTIGTWKSKTQQMSEYLGDLDDLGQIFDSNPFYPNPDEKQDSSFVAALNSQTQIGDRIHFLFFEAGEPISSGAGNRPVTAIFHGESAHVRNILRVDKILNTDDAMPGPNFNQNDKPYWLGDSPGTHAFDFVCDSAHMDVLKVRNFLDVNDSAFIYDRVRIGGMSSPHDRNGTAEIDSATITNLHAVNMHSDSARVTGNTDVEKLFSPAFTTPIAVVDELHTTIRPGEPDSAHVRGNLHADALFSPVFTTPNATFNELAINQLHIDGDGYVGLVKKFRIENENNVTRFGAYFLDDSS